MSSLRATALLTAVLTWSLGLGAEECRPPSDLSARAAAASPAESQLEIGYWFAERGETECARAAFEIAVRLDPNSLPARYNLGLAFNETGDHRRAAEHLSVAARLAPEEPYPRAALAQALLRLGRLEEAEREARAALGVEPDFEPAQRLLALIKAERAKNTAEGAALRRALDLAAASRFAEAEATLRPALAERPAEPRLLETMGMILARQRRLDEAAAVFRRLIEASPDSAEARLSLGSVLADASRLDAALTEFTAAVRLNPGLAAARFSRARALYDLRRDDEARDETLETLRLTGEDSRALRLMGMIENRAGRFGQARDWLERATRADPNDDVTRKEFGLTLLQLGHRREAIEELRRAVEINPRNTQAAAALIRALASQGLPEAKERSDRLREMKKDEFASNRARFLSNQALAAADEENWPLAVGRLREAVETCGECPVLSLLRKNLGLVLYRAGDREAALAELRAARELNPEDRDIAYALEAVATAR